MSETCFAFPLLEITRRLILDLEVDSILVPGPPEVSSSFPILSPVHRKLPSLPSSTRSWSFQIEISTLPSPFLDFIQDPLCSSQFTLPSTTLEMSYKSIVKEETPTPFSSSDSLLFNLANQLATLLLDPDYTLLILRYYRPLVIDLVSRWNQDQISFPTWKSKDSLREDSYNGLRHHEWMSCALGLLLPLVPQIWRLV